jgi:hypothetical protein
MASGFFDALDGVEAPHARIEHDDKLAKYWLVLVELAKSRRFRGAR